MSDSPVPIERGGTPAPDAGERDGGPGAAPAIAAVGSADESALTGRSERFGLAGGPWAEWQSAVLPAGTDLGGVTIIRLLGEGGMGRVYEGRQEQPRRTVAVKVIRDGLFSPAVVKRFEHEAHVLARLRHPHIAHIHTCGTFTTPLGAVPFFVMELVEDARPITQFVAEAGLPVRQRVTLCREVCAAVAHGHLKGVIHRDLKPGNILIDAAGEPKVIDFGVARTTDADQPVTMMATGAGEVVGTLRYMSPEQLAADPADVDARTDVYALGLVLHEVIVGHLPYDLRGRSIVEAARLLTDSGPVSAAAVERAAHDEGRLPAADARALAVIVATCLEKRPSDRYATAVELEAELGRWLAGEPILARPPTPLESALRLARRHRGITAAAIGAVASLVFAIAGITLFSLRADRERRAAEVARAAAERREQEADRQAAAARAELAISTALLAAEARDRGNVAEARRLLDEARRLEAGIAHPLELDCLAASLDESLAVVRGPEGTVTAVAWSPDGSRLATGGSDGAVRLCRPRDGDTELLLRGHEAAVWSIAFAADGNRLATAAADKTVRIWDARTGAPAKVIDDHDGAVYAVAYSPDGRWLATASRDGTARIRDAGSFEERHTLRGHQGSVYGICFSPDGATAATAGQDGTARLWDVATGTPRAELRGHESRVFHAAFAADGETLATASADGTARLWSVTAGVERRILRHPFRVNAVAFLDQGTRVATASGDGLLRIWETASDGEPTLLRGHAGPLWAVATAADGETLATGSADATARVWNPDRAGATRVAGDGKVLALACAADGGTVAIGKDDSEILFWDARTLQPRGRVRTGAGRINAVAFSPDGRTVAAACDDGTARILDPATATATTSFRTHEQRVYSVDVSGAGLMATASEDRTARLWSLASGAPVGPPLKHPRRVFCAAFSPDGTRLATACEDRSARLWDVAEGRELRRFTGHTGPVNWVAFSSDGNRLATASSDGTVRLWHATDGAELAVLTGPARQVWKVAFTPDSRRVVAVSADGTAQLWDAVSGRTAGMLRGHRDQVWALACAPDSRALFTGSWDGTVRIWGISAAKLARRRDPPPGPQAWNQFRGPSGDGRSAARLPVAWSEQRNVRWKTAVPGKAWASPVEADGRIWLANATEDGKRLSAVCVAAATGTIEHDITLFEPARPMFCHPYNSYASPTPVIVDGRVFVHFGSAGTACLDAATAAILWRRDDLPCDHHRGPGSSPIPFDDTIVVNFDGFDRQYVIALDQATGRTIWKTDRTIDYGSDDGDLKKAYCTPIVFEHDGRLQLVSPGAAGTVAYDPRTGRELWKVHHGGYNAAARPLYAHGLVIINTYDGDRLLAVRPDGTGDVTKTHVAWKFGKSTPTRPSQAIVGDFLYMVNDTGIFTCLDARTGKPRWQERRTGRHSAALLAAEGRLYACDEDGATLVVEANPETFVLLSENRLDDGCMASPAVVGDDLLIRTKTHLYRIGDDEAARE